MAPLSHFLLFLQLPIIYFSVASRSYYGQGLSLPAILLVALLSQHFILGHYLSISIVSHFSFPHPFLLSAFSVTSTQVSLSMDDA